MDQTNQTARYELTIIVPVYNEADGMPALERALADYLPHALRKACVLFVDDGSTDGSLRLIRDICSRQTDFFFLALARNGGLSGALKAASMPQHHPSSATSTPTCRPLPRTSTSCLPRPTATSWSPASVQHARTPGASVSSRR